MVLHALTTAADVLKMAEVSRHRSLDTLRRSRSTCSLKLALNALPPDPKVTFDR
jgi:hypothetical protein